MKPTAELCEKVRSRLVEMTGTDPGPVNLRDVVPGTDPKVTEDQIAEEIAKALVHKVRGQVGHSTKIKGLMAQIDVRAFVKQFDKKE
jgi:hypothetical protein